jgi:nitroreductase
MSGTGCPTTSEDLVKQSQKLLEKMQERRSVRNFGNEAIPREVIENCIGIAASAPSGANNQQWSFVLVEDPEMKRKIRESSESVERAFYAERITDEWRSQLKQLATNCEKPFLEEAPYLICIFQQKYSFTSQGEKKAHYYSSESLGIATGFLISALHQLGISSLTYTPAPMGFFGQLLGRPENEKPYMVLAVGYPRQDYIPPRISKKRPEEYLTII